MLPENATAEDDEHTETILSTLDDLLKNQEFEAPQVVILAGGVGSYRDIYPWRFESLQNHGYIIEPSRKPTTSLKERDGVTLRPVKNNYICAKGDANTEVRITEHDLPPIMEDLVEDPFDNLPIRAVVSIPN